MVVVWLLVVFGGWLLVVGCVWWLVVGCWLLVVAAAVDGAESESLAPFGGKEVQQGEEKEGGHLETKPTFFWKTNACRTPEHQWLVQM